MASDRDRASRARLRGGEGRIDRAAGHDRSVEDQDLYSGVGVLTVLSGAALIVVSVLDEAGALVIEVSGSGRRTGRATGRAVGLELLAKGAVAIIERSRPG